MLIPGVWGLILAHKGWPSLGNLFLFCLGAFCMRSVGCAYNDWVDAPIDARVQRTKQRPFAELWSQRNTGAIQESRPKKHQETLISNIKSYLTSHPWQRFLTQACLASAFLVLITTFLWLSLSGAAKQLALFLAIAILPYPWLKRFFPVPQLYLGGLFSSGSLLAFAHVSGWSSFQNLGVITLYGAGILWTVLYDTIYAYQDYKDDQTLGLGSLAVFLGKKPAIFFSLVTVLILCLLVATGIFFSLSFIYFVMLWIAALHFFWQLKILNVHDPKHCWRFFFMNQLWGGWVALSLLCGLLLD